MSESIKGMDRRLFLGLTAASIAGASIAEAAVDSTNPPARAVVPATHATPQQFMVGNEYCCCDWRWNGEAKWRMGSKESSRWYDDGPLNDNGRKIILEHFHIEKIADRFDLRTIETMSPAQLIAARRAYERACGETSCTLITSTRVGGEIAAEQCS